MWSQKGYYTGYNFGNISAGIVLKMSVPKRKAHKETIMISTKIQIYQ